MLTVIATVAGVISAAAVLIGVVYWLVTRESRAARSARERQVSDDVAEMGDRIERLEKVIAAVAADAEGRRPAPSVCLQTGDGPVQAARLSRRAPPMVDLERIIASERRAALSTLPAVTKQPDLDEANIDRLTGSAIRGIARAIEAMSARYEGVTDEDRKNFERSVDSYVASLRHFIPRWLEYLESRREIVAFVANIDNSGGAPATDASVRLNFPDPCARGEAPEAPKKPARPVFSPREKPWVAAGLPSRTGPSACPVVGGAQDRPSESDRAVLRGRQRQGSVRIPLHPAPRLLRHRPVPGSHP